jgi:hypothetical protein
LKIWSVERAQLWRVAWWGQYQVFDEPERNQLVRDISEPRSILSKIGGLDGRYCHRKYHETLQRVAREFRFEPGGSSKVQCTTATRSKAEQWRTKTFQGAQDIKTGK